MYGVVSQDSVTDEYNLTLIVLKACLYEHTQTEVQYSYSMETVRLQYILHMDCMDSTVYTANTL